MCLNCKSAYFAGLVDGEGYLGIRNSRNGKANRLSALVTVGNVNKEPLQLGVDTWGGCLTKAKTVTGKTLWTWHITSGRITRFLSAIEPFMIIKKYQAKYLLEFQKRVTDQVGIVGRRLTEEEKQIRLDYQSLIKTFNQRKYYRPVTGGCLNCSCGNLHSNQGDPLNLTFSRLNLMALRNNSTVIDQATNILATLLGYVSKEKPLGSDKIEVRLTRINLKPETEARYVERRRTRGIEESDQ